MLGDPVRLAATLGARPLLLLAVLIAALGLTAGLVALVTRWAVGHAARAWRVAVGLWKWLADRPFISRFEHRFPKAWHALRKLDPDEYLLLHASTGFALVVAAAGFVTLADGVAAGQTVVQVDEAFAASVHASASPTGVAVFRAFTRLGGTPGLVIVAILTGIGFVWRRRHLFAIGWAVAMIGVALLNASLKLVFARPRPVFEAPHEVAAGWSFPSGHAMATFVAAGMLAYMGVLVARTKPRRLAIVVAAAAWTVAMGFSRLYLGVHYLSDVAGGFAAGAVWLAACVSGVEIARRASEPPPSRREGRRGG